MSSGELVLVGPGGGFVVGALPGQTVEDADEPVREGAEGLVVGGAGGAVAVVKARAPGELVRPRTLVGRGRRLRGVGFTDVAALVGCCSPSPGRQNRWGGRSHPISSPAPRVSRRPGTHRPDPALSRHESNVCSVGV